MARTSVKEAEPEELTQQPLQDRAMGAVKQAPDAVRQAASIMVEKAPDAISASQGAINEAGRRLQTSSTQELTTWAAFSVGVWLGLVLARAPKLMVLAATLPTLVISGALVSRRDRGA